MTEAILVELKEESASVGADLLVFYIPPPSRVDESTWADTQRKYGVTDEDWAMEKAAIELAAICQRNGINYIDPTETMIAEASTLETAGKSLYYATDRHWNPDGHKFVGEVLAEYISSHYLANEQ